MARLLVGAAAANFAGLTTDVDPAAIRLLAAAVAVAAAAAFPAGDPKYCGQAGREGWPGAQNNGQIEGG